MKLRYVTVFFLAMVFAGCGDDDPKSEPTCSDGIQNGDEEGVDCGGVCRACEAEPTCSDGVQNGDEEGVDCGGVCRACEAEPTCSDGVQNGDEEGVDCGGSCDDCAPEPACDDGVQNGDETGVDCGGSCTACEPTPSCDDGVQNGDEEGVDCGGSCERCRVEAPQGWLCPADSYDDLQCDCGCGVVDEDCADALAQSCESTACSSTQKISAQDNSQCVDLPTEPGNLSFELTPSQEGTIPNWRVVRRDGISDTMVVGPAQTTAPDGSRALYLTSSYRFDMSAMMGFPSPVEVASEAFVPEGTECEITVAIGDANEVTSNSDYGLIRIEAVGAPAPLDVLSEVTIDTRGGAGSVAPTADNYQDILLSFTHDGSYPLMIVIIADASFDTKAFHVDHVRISCV